MATTATIVTRIKKLDNNYMFETNKGNLLITVIKADNSTVKVLPSLNSDLHTSIETVVGCFDKDSNFNSKISTLFNCNQIKNILLVFNGINLLITQESTKFEIYQQWEQLTDANYAQKVAHQDWLNSKVLFKDQASIKAWYNYAKSTPSNVMALARRLAKCMQSMLPSDADVSVNDIAKAFDKTSYIVELFSGTAYAIKILSQCWKYGDEIYQYYFVQNCCAS